jgi:hypothetical protein
MTNCPDYETCNEDVTKKHHYAFCTNFNEFGILCNVYEKNHPAVSKKPREWSQQP